MGHCWRWSLGQGGIGVGSRVIVVIWDTGGIGRWDRVVLVLGVGWYWC